VHGSERDAEDLCDLRRGVASPVAKDDRGSALQRQCEDGVEQIPVSLSGFCVVPLRHGRLDGLEGLQPALPAGEVDGLVENDPREPGPEGAPSVEVGEAAKGALKCVLSDVVRRSGASGDGEREPPGR
jgi:hypothetical protein